MTAQIDRLIRSALLAICVAFPGASLRASVLFEVQVHLASGPVSVQTGQTVSSCAANPDASPISVLIALLQADNSNLLISRQLILQPGAGVCVNFVPPAGNNQQPLNVYTVVVPNGRFDSLGRILQDRPGGGGCIVGSLQAQTPSFNNVPGQTIVFAQMTKHDHSQDQHRGVASRGR